MPFPESRAGMALARRRTWEQAMNYIIAIIKPHRLDNVRAALEQVGIEGLTVSEVRGHGRQKGHTEFYRGAEYQVHFLPKTKLEIAVEEERTEQAVEAIVSSARTASIGDGKIFVLPLKQVVRIRTGETGSAAL
jgi:nitrogen regulatory protein PII